MNVNKKINNFNEKFMQIDPIISEDIEAELVNSYNELNEKCDVLISKIRVRKAKKKSA